MYINIQTVLLSKLKYNYLRDSILFFGSYFETMVHIVLNMHHSIDLNLLETIRSFARYLSQMCNYTKELLIHISSSMQNLEVNFFLVVILQFFKNIFFFKETILLTDSTLHHEIIPCQNACT